MDKPHQNKITQDSLINWRTQYKMYLSRGATNFASMYPNTPLSYFIIGINLEFPNQSRESNGQANNFPKALDNYRKGATKGDCLSCLRIAEIYSIDNNPFDVDPSEEIASIYMSLAMFYSLCSPFGHEIEIRPLFTKFIVAIGDDFSLKKSLDYLGQFQDPQTQEYFPIIQGILPTVFAKHKDPRFKVEKFRHVMKSNYEVLDSRVIGAFTMNLYSGGYSHDEPIYVDNHIREHFNKEVKNLFSLVNLTFNVDNELATMMLTGHATNVWHYLMWKGKQYRGEIDECLIHLIQMCKLIFRINQVIKMPAQIRELFISILAWCHRKGCLLRHDLRKSRYYMEKLDITDTAANVMFEKARVCEKLGEQKEAKEIYQKIHSKMKKQFSKRSSTGFLPYDFYILAIVEQKITGDMGRVKELLERGKSVEKLPSYKVFENLAFQRKCIQKLKVLNQKKQDVKFMDEQDK